MSHQRQVRVLAHNQPAISRRGPLILEEIADLLVQRMAAERITRSVIRMLPPDSVFLPAKNFSAQTHQEPEELLNLAQMELYGLHVKRSNVAGYLRTRRVEAILTVSEYVWGEGTA